MQLEKTKVVVASVVIVAALAFIYVSMTPKPPAVERKQFSSLGHVMAEETIKLLGNNGRVVIFVRDTAVFPNPATDLQLSGLIKTLQNGRTPILATNRVRLDPLRLPRAPAKDFLDAMRKLQDADVIVCLLGPPVLSDEEKARIPEKHPRVMAICTGPLPRQVNLRELFNQNLLHAAIITRPYVESALPKTDSPRTWFDNFYQLITHTNFNELPVPAEGARANL